MHFHHPGFPNSVEDCRLDSVHVIHTLAPTVMEASTVVLKVET